MSFRNEKPYVYSLALAVVLFLLGRLLGGVLFDYHWSFNHWLSIPTWYLAAWLLLTIIVAIAFVKWPNRIASLFDSRGKVFIWGIVLLVLFYLFRFDSFVYGDGNIRINQIANVEKIFLRWFEYGSLAIATLLYKFLQAADFLLGETNQFRIKLTAATNAWVVISCLCTILSIAGAVKLIVELNNDRIQRWLLFVILFFGPHTLLYFGYIGIETVVLAFTIWYAVLAFRVSRQFTIKRLLILWLIQVMAIVFHVCMIYLIPATIFLTVSGFQTRNNLSASAWSASLISYIILVVIVYYQGAADFAFSRNLLFLAGKNPHTDYGLFSLRHLGDISQSILLVFPQFLILLYMIIRGMLTIRDRTHMTALITGISGLTLFFILDPANGMPFDLPRMSVYLLPLSILLTVMVSKSIFNENIKPLFVSLLAAMSISIPLSTLPAYTRIAIADSYLVDFLEGSDEYYLSGAVAFRDSYFYRRDMDLANNWEWRLPIKSEAYLNFRGCSDLYSNGQYSDAIMVLNRMILQDPYWVDPRAMLAAIHTEVGRPHLAFPHLDTCLMLDPYNKEHYQKLYAAYRDSRKYPDAIMTLNEALELYPGNKELLTDLMIANHRIGQLFAADSLANLLIARDSLNPFPYAVKGLLAELDSSYSVAANYFDIFIRLAPDEPEAAGLRIRADSLRAMIQKKR